MPSIDSNATRNTAELYPDVVAFRDIRTFSRASLHVALSGVEIEIEFVIGMGGSPCQDRVGIGLIEGSFGRSCEVVDRCRSK